MRNNESALKIMVRRFGFILHKKIESLEEIFRRVVRELVMKNICIFVCQYRYRQRRKGLGGE